MTCAAETAYRRAKNRREFNELVVRAFNDSDLPPDEFVAEQESFLTRYKIDPAVIRRIIRSA